MKYKKKEGGDCIYDDLQISILGNSGPLPDDNPNYFVSSHNKATVYIPRFVIAWGCYAADTLINTVDGTKQACEIRKGDKLPVYGGKVLTISSVITGNDRAIFRITTTDGRSIRVSGGHAMKMYSESRPDGKKIAAARLKKGDRLMTPDNVVEISSVEIEEYNDKVYNFTFEEDHSANYIMANGFWSGDFHAQNEPEFCEIPEKTMAIINDMKQYVNDMKK
jgi:intein/homing endonuclease